MNTTNCPYTTLGVLPSATQSDIKKAYRKLSMQYHPDRNNNDPIATKKFQEISAAYDLIDSEEKRKTHDFNQSMGLNGDAGPLPEELMKMFMGGGLMNLFGGDNPNIRVFTSHDFGHDGMPNSNFPPSFKQSLQKPQPIIKKIRITINQAFLGGSIPLEIERKILTNNITESEIETIYINIPPGIDDKEMIIMREKGHIINSQKGDVKVFINIENNSNFTRDGLDIIIEKSISLKDSLCGFNFELNYINGKTYKFNNSRGNIISDNYRKDIPKLGFKRDGHCGKMVIVFKVIFPETLTEDQMTKLSDIL